MMYIKLLKQLDYVVERLLGNLDPFLASTPRSQLAWIQMDGNR